jgi:hypothetical protein
MNRLIVSTFFALLMMCSKVSACEATLFTIKEFSVCLPYGSEVIYDINGNESSIFVIDRSRGSTSFTVLEKEKADLLPQFESDNDSPAEIIKVDQSRCIIRRYTGASDLGEDIIDGTLFSLDLKAHFLLSDYNYMYEAILDYCR